jgi:hypothetical protein
VREVFYPGIKRFSMSETGILPGIKSWKTPFPD